MGYRSSRSYRASESESADDSARDRRQDTTDNARLSTARASDIETRSHQTDGDSIPSRRHTSQRLRENPALSKPGSAYDSDRVPDTIHWENYRSIQRSRATTHDQSSAGDTGVPESVRNVVSSPGHSLDTAVQRAMEDRMGDSFGDVQVHTGAQAASACEDINAKAFTVGNHIAFNRGEYDPSSAEGQHVIAHELAHVRQQTGGAVSMLPQDDVEFEIHPDPELEREAEETAQRVMEGGELGIQRLETTAVHVQRVGRQTRFDEDGNLVREESDAFETITEIVQTIDRAGLLVDHDATPEGVRRTLANLTETGKLRPARLQQFLTDLNTLLAHDVENLGHVIGDDIADSTIRNVDGALYEFLVGARYVEDVGTVKSIGRTETTVRVDELRYEQVEQIVADFVMAAVRNQAPDGDESNVTYQELTDEEIDSYIAASEFFDAKSKSDLEHIIKAELNPTSDGLDRRSTELDILKIGDDYLEAKSGRISTGDIMKKIVRFKAHQLAGTLESSGSMTVVGRTNGKFRRKDGGLRKVTKLIEQTSGVDWDSYGGKK